jgi:organic radical activating enzyme
LWQDFLESGIPGLSIVCSPKIGHPVHDRIKERADACKIIYGSGVVIPKDLFGDIYVQPLDVKDDTLATDDNTAVSVALCLARGWRLSLQTHKLLGLQ